MGGECADVLAALQEAKTGVADRDWKQLVARLSHKKTLGAHSPGPVLGPASWTRRHPVPHVSRTDPCNKVAAGLTIREIAT